MSEQRITDQLNELLAALAADLSPTGLSLEAGVYDLTRCRWLTGQRPEVPVGFGGDGYVLTLPGRQHRVPTDRRGKPDLAEIMNDVQDWAIDELGHGWPELCDDEGDFVALLEPDRDGSRCVWAAQGHLQAVVGELARLRIALPSAEG